MSCRRMNISGLQDVNAIPESFQTQVCGSTSIFVRQYKFHKRPQGPNESFEEFYIDLQYLLNNYPYEDCCKTESRMSCKERVFPSRLVAGISSYEVRKSLSCIQDLTLGKAVQHVKVDEATSFQVKQLSYEVNKTAASTYKKSNSNKTLTPNVPH